MTKRGRTPKAKPFEEAFRFIDQLEHRVVERTTEVNFTAWDVVTWLYPPEVIRKLSEAYPLLPYYRDQTISENVPIGSGYTYTIRLSAKSVKVPAPETGTHLSIQSHLPQHEHIVSALTNVRRVHNDFEKVRLVVSWLNDYASPGAARHYCPWLTSVLPSDHAFHKATGQVFREPRETIVGITPVMRQCAAIMAGALLAGTSDAPDKIVLIVKATGSAYFGLL